MEQVDKRTKILMHRSNKQLVKIWTLYGLLIVTILIMVLNALELKREQKNITEQYVDDVTGQLSEDIGEQIQAYLRSLNLLADTMEYIPSRVNRDEFLTEAGKAFGI